MKILKNHRNDLLSNISICILPTWILCCHSKEKSPAPVTLQPSILAKITSYCFLPGGQECTWTQHTTEALTLMMNLSVSVTESDYDKVAVPKDNSSLCFRIHRISTWLDEHSCPAYLNTYFICKNFSIFILFPLSAYLSSLKILWISDLPLVEMKSWGI